MGRMIVVAAALMLLVGLVALVWGVVLVWSGAAGREFQPQGSVGIVLVVGGGVLTAAGLYGVLREERG